MQLAHEPQDAPASGPSHSPTNDEATATATATPASTPMATEDKPSLSFPIFPLFPISHSSPSHPSLSSKSSSFSSAPLFDHQSPEFLHSIPGSLHLASDASIERLIQRFGAVSLIRQLAKDVAERDAFISNVKFHYESRESVFRDLLREHGLDPVIANTKLAKQRTDLFSVVPPSFSSSVSSTAVPASAPPIATSAPLFSSQFDETFPPLLVDKPFLQTKISSAINEPLLPSSPSSSSPALSDTHPTASSPSNPLQNFAGHFSSKHYHFDKSSSPSPSPTARPSPKPSNSDMASPIASPTFPALDLEPKNDKPLYSFSHSTVEVSDSFSESHSAMQPFSGVNFTFPDSVELDNIIPKQDLPPTLRNDWNPHTKLKSNQTLDQFGFVNNFPASSDRSSETLKPLRVFNSFTTSSSPNFGSGSSQLDKLPLSYDTLDTVQMKRWDDYVQKYSIKYGKFDESSNELLGKCSLGKTKRSSKKRFEKFRRLVKKGVPVPYRPKVWLECSGAHHLHVPGYYDELLAKSERSDPSNQVQIDQDIKRTLVRNIFFGGKGPGVPKLRRVLLAYSLHNPAVGYCQGMNVIVAFFLLIYASEEEVFYLIMSLIENYLPQDYFTADLLGSRADQIVLKEYVDILLPQVSSHLKELKVDLEAVTFHWFLSMFTDTVGTKLGFRILDLFFCDGYPCLFRVALSIIYTLKDKILACNTSFAVYSLLCDLRSYPFDLDAFLNCAAEKWKHQINEEDLQERHARAMSLL
ncbi:GTPase activating protein [Schizosaccharomyces cryophilus OY26]|uniref:GTPase activating protein n=1 Tax=Schizosaccharomyces cryophilus (strain OY26 / ATCC MYA-4695 / CBS 11777 / NBRC 106824 / NRRL Y48691) TaxID=653667 RepID=S9W684_SCHCR|nr:GTPase activating protein [Schizosaccharomyces cryophilus OY26]EPY54079.1 GTPase activating protein [Schizosaccharomyces cryophilus OY26]